MNVLIIAVVGLLAVATAGVLAPRVRIAAPLLLVLVGIGVSFLPFVPVVEVDPEWILAGILPPLLYSAAVSVPTMNFRRELNAIGGLSVVLVVLSALVLGVFFAWVIPGLGLWWGIALGAIVSPTDAVATSIVKRSGVSGRVISVLEGESLLNDATALVLLRTAIAGTAASVTFWGVLGNFAFAVVVAAALGWAVGELNLWVRSRLTDSTVNTVISFTVPFLASIPAELLGASGLVAAVVAGLVTGHGAARRLPPQHRLSDSQNWRSIELMLEGAIFLIMGLELAGLIEEVGSTGNSVWIAAAVAASALVLILLLRAAYITPLLVALRARARRGAAAKPQLHVMQQRLENSGDSAPELTAEQSALARKKGKFTPTPARIERFNVRIRRTLADIDYLLQAPLGWREGSVLVWAGMRGAITLAAAQTLPPETPHRSLLILIAFTVAAASLLIQGSTLARFVAWIKPAKVDEQADAEERRRIHTLLREIETDIREKASQDASVVTGEEPHHNTRKKLALTVIKAQRAALLDARDDGIYAAETLSSALTNLDADQISIELKGAPAS